MSLPPSPQSSLPLTLRLNSRSQNPDYRNRLVIDIDKFPTNANGAYVIRFADKLIPRFVGESQIIKIGMAGISFSSRFKQYNNKNETSVYAGDTFSFYQNYKKALTDYETMWRLPRLAKLGQLVVDFHYSSTGGKTPLELEKYLLCLYVEKHMDTPPLNKGLS